MNEFIDERGTIKDLFVNDEYSITHITFEPGSVRGNHYHERTRQVDILIKGKLRASYKRGNIVNEQTINTGDIMNIEAGIPHAYKAIEGSEMLSICFGVRRGSDYEKDVIRLEVPLLK